MSGIQGKSAKSALRTTSFSKPASARPGGRVSTMATSTGNGIRSRASSCASERPERLSLTNRVPSPYNSNLSGGVISSASGDNNGGRRVQSAATSRQRSALGGPTIKASEFFRKNHSEPQLTKPNSNIKSGTKTNSTTVKSVKHVRIDTTESRPSKDTSSNLLGIHGSSAFSSVATNGSNRRRPFSFSVDRSRSVSVASNESFSTLENDILQEELESSAGDRNRNDFEDVNTINRNNNNLRNTDTSSTNSTDSQKSTVLMERTGKNPRFNKRSYSMDIGEMESDQDDNFWNASHDLDDFHSQKIEMRIAEHPEKGLKEENVSASRRINSARGNFTRAHTEDSTIKAPKLGNARLASEQKCQSDFDRMLLKQSDNLLQGVNDLINEIKSTETSKMLQKSTSLTIFEDDSCSSDIEKLIADLRNDMNKQKVSDSSLGKSDISPEKRPFINMVDDRLNFSTLTMSGTELSDITCPIQVMEQSESVPSTGRSDRPLSAIVLGNNSNVSRDIIAEAESYLLINRELSNARNNNSNDGFDSSSNSNNQTFPSSEALSIIEQRVTSQNNAELGSARPVSSSSSHHSGHVISQEEIQQKISSALQLLEDEHKRFRRGESSKREITSGRDTDKHFQSLYLSASNPNSRPESRGEARSESSSKSSPRIRSDERNNMPRDSFDSVRHSSSSATTLTDHNEGRREMPMMEPHSARSCSCLMDRVSTESLNSARSTKTTAGILYSSSCSDVARHNRTNLPRASSNTDNLWETKDDKTKQIFSFLDEVEKSDQEMLFGLRFETDCLGRPKAASKGTIVPAGVNAIEPLSHSSVVGKKNSNEDKQVRSMDSLIRKSSVELAREILMLERKLEEAQHTIKLLEESMLTQRDLNIRTLRNTEKDFKKRMKMQKEEFEQLFERNEAQINQMAHEKRDLQEKLDKLIKNFEAMEEKHKEQVKSLQQSHLDEIKRLRKMQQNAENSLKKNLAGNTAKAQEIREMTVKGLEPEVQRIIQRHQQEMTEMRAWHADEVREIEERYQRKLHMQLEDLRQKFAKEKEDLIIRERELANRRIQAELKQKDDEIEGLKRRHANELFEERERAVSEETRLKECIQESIRKAQIKAEVELENLKQEYETKLVALERRHESEIKSVKDVFEAERQNWATTQMKKLEQALAEQETRLKETFQVDKEKEWREKERKLKEEFEKFRKDDEMASESRFRRMQEKFQTELNEMEKTEKDVKTKFSQAKSDLLAREEEVFGLKASVSMKDKQLVDLQEMNMKMQEERVNLTSVIRREFTDQIQAIEEECRSLKSSIVEVQSNAKLQIEQKQLEIEKIIAEKDSEIERIGLRVKQALGRKDETISELQKQLEKSSYEIRHLEEMLEEQRKEFLHGMTKMSSAAGGGRGQKK